MKKIIILLLCFLLTSPISMLAYSLEGSSGYEVEQIKLKLKDLALLDTDDILSDFYDTKTKNAVMTFQKNNSLIANGICDAQTLSALNIKSTDGDFFLLCCYVAKICNDTDYICCVAVANVLLNRINSPYFGNTVAAAATNLNVGALNILPDTQIINAVREAKINDITGGALGFYNLNSNDALPDGKIIAMKAYPFIFTM